MVQLRRYFFFLENAKNLGRSDDAYPGYQVFTRVRRGASFRRPQVDKCSAEGFFRLDRNRKPRMKSLWHPG